MSLIKDGRGRPLFCVVDPSGNLYQIALGTKAKAGKLKPGWRLATQDDLDHASELERIRAVEEKAKAEAATAAVKAEQEAAELASADRGGPLE